MPIDFTIQKNYGFMLSTWTGSIDDVEFTGSFLEMIKENKEWLPGLHHIADLTAADLSKVTGKGIRDLAALMNQYTVRDMKGRTNKVAVLLKDPTTDYILTIYKAFFNKSERDIQAFTNITDALEWINRDPRCDDE